MTTPFYKEIYSCLKAAPSDELDEVIALCLAETEFLKVNSFYTEATLTRIAEKEYDTGFFRIGGNLITATLKDAPKAVLLAATLGIRSDALIRRTYGESAARGVVMDAVLSAKIEFAVNDMNDAVTEEYLKKGFRTGKRISAGYGDWKLSDQRKYVEAFGLNKRLGVYLSGADMFTPAKTVTALIPLFPL
ncbi:MAG: hypothetical protein LBT55_03240 [Clostridiaceae bacterium]|jgi:hypothetical protein|nr:hypothetical protein [Clostridiaceae bacterium]